MRDDGTSILDDMVDVAELGPEKAKLAVSAYNQGVQDGLLAAARIAREYGGYQGGEIAERCERKAAEVSK